MIKNFLILGLGNPGALLKHSRHNIGFDFVCWLKDQYRSSDWRKNGKNFAQISIFEHQDKKIFLALPLIFMNESGRVVKQLIKYYQFSPNNIIIVHDDNDINIGNFKFSFSRGSAGHRGVESIIKNLGIKNFYRLRIGIQPNQRQRQKAENLVLKNFSSDERKSIIKKFTLMKKTIENKIKINSYDESNEV